MILAEHEVPRWAVVVTFLLSLAGLGLSIYLTVSHYTGARLAGCPVAGVVNCSVVTTSAQSYILGIPVAVLGLANFIVMTALNSPWAWRATSYWIHLSRFVLAVLAMGFVLWLVFAELIIIKHLCEYCTGVHVITFALLIVLTTISPVQLGWTRLGAQ